MEVLEVTVPPLYQTIFIKIRYLHMYIDLTWVNLNNVNVTLNIYKGNDPLDRDLLPEEPVAVIADGKTSWRDHNVELGKTYYYVFETISDTDTHVSVNYPIRAINRRGIGPQDIVDGDANLGYFGTVSSGQFITTNELKEKVGLDDGAVNQPFPIWHKFIRNNKVLFIPHTPIMQSLSFNHLWNANVVYGNEVAPNPFIAGGKKVVTIGADQYIVRLMTGYRDDSYEEWDADLDSANEFSDLIYPLAHSVMKKQKLNNIFTNGIKFTEFFPGGNAQVLTQEAVSGTLVTSRGVSKTSANDDGTTDMRTYYDGGAVNFNRTTASYRWWPVLELIEVKPEIVPDVLPLSIAVDTTIAGYTGATGQITTTVTPELANQSVTYESSAPTVISVDELGNYNLLTVGSATITVTAVGDPSVTTTIVYEVEDEPVPEPILPTSVTVTSGISGNVGDTGTIVTEVLPAEANQAVTYSSSDDTIISVTEAGVYSLLKEGTATITIATVEGVDITTTETHEVTAAP